MDITVVGCGYVGLVTAVCFSSLGHDVLAIEIDEKRADLIRRAIPPFYEPGLNEMLTKVLSEGRLRVGNDIGDALNADVIFLCVQTPQSPDGSLDTSFLVAAANQLKSVLEGSSRRRVIVVRSTVTPGTTENLVGPAVGANTDTLSICTNPEFLREGSAVSDFMEPDRVVIGSRQEWAADMVAELYSHLDAPIIHTSPPAAELAKCTSNALLATLISFSNQIARIAERVRGVDVEDVLEIIHKDRRFSPLVERERIAPGILAYLKSGCGFGGSCLPKDLNALIRFASHVGEPASMLEAVKEINDGQPIRLVSATAEALGGLKDKSVTVLGLAFKAGTDDLRESPGIKVVDLLLDAGVRVKAYDPLVSGEAVVPYVERGLEIAPSLQESLHAADACVITSLDPAFTELERILREVGKSRPAVIDGRRLLDPGRFDEDGATFVAVGRSPSATQKLQVNE
jgi:UDPglucose 6-dehydrogenase